MAGIRGLRGARGAGVGPTLLPVAACIFAFGAVLLTGCAAPVPDASSRAVVDSGAAVPVIEGSGRLVTRDLTPGEFSELEVGSAFKVDVVQGESFTVSVTADDNLIDMVEVSRQGERLSVGLKSRSFRNATYRARIGMPDLRVLHLSGASRATMTGLKPEGLQIGLSGASQLTGRLDGGRLLVSMRDASGAILGGNAGELTLDASGASQASFGDLNLGVARVNLASASSATVNVARKLDADLRGASSLYYVGSPSLGSISSVEGSSLRQR